MLKIDNISKRFGRAQVLHGVTFHVSPGEIVGFVGPNGAGKTTALKVATGLIRPDSGSVLIAGYDMARDRVRALAQVAAMIEGPSLFYDLTGRDHVNFIAKLRGASRAQVDECLAIADLGVWLNRPVGKYSLGMKQRLGIALCLLPEPKLLLLDEPTNGLDPNAMLELRETLVRLRQRKNMAILFSSHMLSEVEKIADRVVCIRKGALVDAREMALPPKYLLSVDKPRAALEILSARQDAAEVSLERDGRVSFMPAGERLNELMTALIGSGVTIWKMESAGADLEAQYRSLYMRCNAEAR